MLKTISKSAMKKNFLWMPTLSILVFGVVIYTAILIAPPFVQFSEYFSTLPFSIAVLLFLLFFIIFVKPGYLSDAAGITLTLAVFGLALAYRWQSGYVDSNLIAGLLPWSDASAHYNGAERLLYGDPLSSFATRRPLFAAMLATLLSLLRGNLQSSLAIFGAINAIAAFIFAREIRQTHGGLSAALVLTLETLFFKMFIGKSLSENLGFALGALGLAMIWRGTVQNRMPHIWFGLFALALGLNARAGALVILPFIVVWGFFNYQHSRKEQLAWTVGACITIAIAFTINLILVKLIGSSEGQAFSNYSYTMYGLVVGNKGWSQVLSDYPGIQENMVWEVVWKHFLSQPILLLKGMWGSFLDFFSPSIGGFSFVNYSEPINKALWICTAVSMVLCLYRIKNKQASLALMMFIGVLMSAPLVPPIDADRMRAYAATIPAFVFAVVAGFSYFFPASKQPEERSPLGSSSLTSITPVLTATVICLATIAPIYIKFTGHLPFEVKVRTCPVGQRWIAIQVTPGTAFYLVPDYSTDISYTPAIRESDFQNALQNGSGYTFLDNELRNLKPGQGVAVGINLAHKVTYEAFDVTLFLVGDIANLKPGILQTCAIPTSNTELRAYSFFYLPNISNNTDTLQPFKIRYSQFAWVWEALVLLLFLAVVINNANSKHLASRLKWLRVISLIAVSPVVILFLHSNGILPFAWEVRPIKQEKIQFSKGVAYSYSLGLEWKDQAKGAPYPVNLFEDGKRLRGANAGYQSVSSDGKGRYQLVGKLLYFSSSDNSDPRINLRQYKLLWPKRFPRRVTYPIYTLFGLGILGLLLSFFISPSISLTWAHVKSYFNDSEWQVWIRNCLGVLKVLSGVLAVMISFFTKRRKTAVAFLLAIIVCFISVSVYLQRTGSLISYWQTSLLDRKYIQHENGYAYIAPTNHPELNSAIKPSPARILENGHPLGPTNALHNEIRNLGEGRTSFWKGYVYFSTSDNSDPVTNGRKYEIHSPIFIKSSAAHILYLVTGLFSLIVFLVVLVEIIKLR